MDDKRRKDEADDPVEEGREKDPVEEKNDSPVQSWPGKGGPGTFPPPG
jgi:hypothetical protein